jgi:hypothetical protein
MNPMRVTSSTRQAPGARADLRQAARAQRLWEAYQANPTVPMLIARRSYQNAHHERIVLNEVNGRQAIAYLPKDRQARRMVIVDETVSAFPQSSYEVGLVKHTVIPRPLGL